MPRKTKEEKPTKQSVTSGKRAFHVNFLHDQGLAWSAFEQNDVLFLLGPAGTGKAQPLDSIVHTPAGPKRMGDIQVGDTVCTPDGNTAPVTGVFPQGDKEIVRIHFHDGSYADCCPEHLWKVSSTCWKWKDRVVDAAQIARWVDGQPRRRLYIPVTEPVAMQRREYLISPYLMGVLIGDGGLSNSNICVTSADPEVFAKVGQEVDGGYHWKQSKSDRLTRRLVKKKRGGGNVYKDELRRLGLWGHKADTKFVPQEYLRGSVDQRLALLRGLMDADGTVDRRSGQPSYSTTSPMLVQSVTTLVNSLGGVVRVSVKEPSYKDADGTAKKGKHSYTLSINLPGSVQPFFLSRKKALVRSRTKYTPKRYIDRVERIGVKPAQCIMVGSRDHLYLTDHYVVTHNTHLACAFALKELLDKRKKRIVITRPIVEAGESLGYLPGTFEEKVHPYMMPIYDCISRLVGYDGPQREYINRCLEVAPLAYLRGRTFHDSVIILDEAQNTTDMQLKMFLSRFAEGSKVIVTGDPDQSDIRWQGDIPLNNAVKRLETLEGVGIVKFAPSGIVRHPLVGKILDRLA